MKFLLSFLFLFPFFLAAQNNRIVGKAVQRHSGAPIPNASVFISGSSLGTVSDSAGNFQLSGIPAGKFELIISSVGFTTAVHPFSSEQLPLQLNIQMDPKPTELNEVTVEPFDPNGWENWGQVFLENFLGTSEAARRCRITNTKTLRFRYNRKTRTLTVVAAEPLQIVNNHLGYTVQYQLEEFVLNQQEGAMLFVGYSLFKDMGGNRNRYNARRQDVYNGSMSHFMRSLYEDRLVEEGFETRRLSYVQNHEKERVRGIMSAQARNNVRSGGQTVMRLGVAPPEDSMTYYRKVMQQPNEFRVLGQSLLGADSLLPVGNDSTRHFAFTGFLQVTFKKRLEEQAYLQYRRLSRKPYYPESIIFLTHESGVMIEPNGYYYPPQNIFSMDYWGWSEKMAHMLPIDYQPPPKNN